MTSITEIAPDTFRLSTYIREIDLQFNQFVVRDEEPLLYHTGMRRIFPLVREAVARLIDPARLRWIGFSHFEADECGALNEWLDVAPAAEAACTLIGALVSVNDFASRPARGMTHGETLVTGGHRFRFLHTPHVPHCWEAGHVYDETTATLFCSDLFHQTGDVEAVTESDIIERARRTLVAAPDYLPYTPHTERALGALAALGPRRVATMHGSTYVGDGARALHDLAAVFRDTLSRAA